MPKADIMSQTTHVSLHATRLTEYAARLLQQGKTEEAKTLLHKALQISPGHEQAAALLHGITSGPTHHPYLSVVIPTCNRTAILERCLAHLAQQTLPAHLFEVIVIDDASAEDVPQILSTRAYPFSLRTWRQPERRGPAQARNIGIRMALGEVIVLLNDDALLCPNALHIHYQAHQALADVDFSLLGSFYLPQAWITTPWFYVLAYSDLVFEYQGLSNGQIYGYNLYYTCNISTPRRALIAAGLFDEDFTGPLWGAEDIELGIRLQGIGCPVTYHRDCQATHWHKLTVDDFARMFRVRGGGAVRMFAKHPEIPVHYRDIRPEDVAFWRELPEEVRQGIFQMHERIHHLCAVELSPQARPHILWEKNLGRRLHAYRNLWQLRTQEILGLMRPLQNQLAHLTQEVHAGRLTLEQAAQMLFPSAVFLRWFHDTEGVCASQDIERIMYPQGQPKKAAQVHDLSCASASSPRILLACDFFWPSVGGTELFVEALGVHLQQAGYEVYIACRHLPQRTALMRQGMTILPFDCRDRFFDPSMGPELARFQHVVCAGGFAAVIALAHPDTWVCYGLAHIPPASRPRLIMMPSINAANVEAWTRRGVLETVRQVLHQADVLIRVSENGYDNHVMAAWGLASVFIPHSVGAEAAPLSMRAHLNIPREQPLFACVGNFWPVKNQLELIQTMRQMEGNWELVLAGAAMPWPKERQYFLDCWQAQHKDPRIRILGPLPPLEAAALIRDADLLLIPSKGESAGPLVALQAMALGTPWIATPQCNAAPDQAGGVVVPLEKFPATVERISCNPHIRQTLAECGHQHWQRCFRWEQALPLFLQVIHGRTPSVDLRMPADLRAAMKQIDQDLHQRSV